MASHWKPHLKEWRPRSQLRLFAIVYTGSISPASIFPGMGEVKVEKPGV